MTYSFKPIILIIDDNKENIKILGNLLINNGYNVDAVWESEKAFDFLNVRLPDLILLDILMPVIDGFTLCKKIKENADFKNIPVIFLTALDDMNSKIEAFNIGGVDYISKPFKNEIVLARIKTHLQLKKQKDKLVELNKIKDLFLSVISHDLKNPLTVIKGLIENFENEKKQGKEHFKKTQKFIMESVDFMMNLIERVCVWSKSQKMVLSSEKIRLKDILDYTQQLISNDLKEKQIDIIPEIPDDFTIFGDYDMLETVIRNLILNAIKFTNTNGKVIIKANEDINYKKILIRDNGIGIPFEDIPRLFDFSNRPVRNGTNGEIGYGYGLLICREFIDRHNGFIEIESEINKGTDFIIYLPE